MFAANDVPASTALPSAPALASPAPTPPVPALPIRGVDGIVPLNSDPRIAAWQRLQFGLFVHWGVYSVYEGSYKGVAQGIGYPEQIKAWMQIPDEEYLHAAHEWQATEWDPAALCAAAKNAGMTYVMITTKHHDGFCMWDTSTTDFNIVAQSAFGRDPLAELAKECAAQGLGLAFYFSIIDWTQHEAEPYANLNAIPESMMPFIEAQIEELLTKYGPIVEFWFDMGGPTPDQSDRLAATVRRCQPDTTVMNSRVWNDRGDFEVGGDNDIPDFFQYGPWESVRSIFPAAWSYCTTDKCDRSPETIIPQIRAAISDLVTVISGGGQFAYNIGPMGSGAIDPYDRQVLEGIGAWMDRHPRAIRGARPTWLPIEAASGGSWGQATAAGSELYLFPARWEEEVEIRLPGVANAVLRAKVDGIDRNAGDHATSNEAARDLPVRREGNDCVVTLVGPCPDDIQPVIRLDLDGPLRVLPASAVVLTAATDAGLSSAALDTAETLIPSPEGTPSITPDQQHAAHRDTAPSRARAQVRAHDLVAHRSAKGYSGGVAAYDAVVVNPSDAAFPHVRLRFSFDEGALPSPTTMYRLTWGDTSLEVSGAELSAGPLHVGAHVGAHAAARLRIEYAHPFYYADALDLRVASIEVECSEQAPSPTAPVVCAEPASVEAYRGERVRLAAAIDAWPPPTYQWYRLEIKADLPDESQDEPRDVHLYLSDELPSHNALPGATTSVLEVEAPESVTSPARYVLVATNERGSVRTQPASVSLRSGEAQRGVPARVGAITVEAVMGENLSMSGDGANRIVTISAGTVLGCSVEVSGDPYPTLQWQVLRSGAVDWEDLPGQSATTWTRIIDTSFNGAKLRVQATNPAGTATSGMVTLRIQ
ncbi:alpha-L-fucosidase [Schaalia canis]|nr:alpha-L-fucosidase [Schaalia canis]